MAADDPIRDLWNRVRGFGRSSHPVILRSGARREAGRVTKDLCRGR